MDGEAAVFIDAVAVGGTGVADGVDEGPAPAGVERRVVEAPPAPTLIEAARNADLLVVGARGRGGFAGLLLGSVSQQCVQGAACPVVIVRDGVEAGQSPAHLAQE
ncbi:universal stress protein [Streptomyces sirii]|uniref:universal stress protein n=1 Tax=Streptomyces sirii TaxID=3127701 RepID=UPI003D36F739